MAGIEAREPVDFRNSNTKSQEAEVGRILAESVYDNSGSRTGGDRQQQSQSQSNVLKEFGNLEIIDQGERNTEGKAKSVQ